MGKIKGLNKHQKAARRPGEQRVNRHEIEQLLEMSCSTEVAERITAASFLCPCHVRRRIPEAWEALYRMMEDPDVQVRRAAWHTLEDGGRPDDPAFEPILQRALIHETDPQVRRFITLFAGLRKEREIVEIKRAELSTRKQLGKCDFCGSANVPVKRDYETEIAALGQASRLAWVCERCGG